MTPTKDTTETTTQIALIAKDISYMKGEITEIKTNFKELTNGFTTKQALEDIAIQTEKRFIKLESASNLWRVLNPTIAAVLGSVLTFLIIQYLQTKK